MAVRLRGLLILNARSGQLIQHLRFVRAYGLPFPDIGVIGIGTAASSAAADLTIVASIHCTARDEMQLGAMLFALHLNAANTALVSSPTSSGLSRIHIGDTLVQFCANASDPELLLVLFIHTSVGASAAEVLANLLLRHVQERRVQAAEPEPSGNLYTRVAIMDALQTALDSFSHWTVEQMLESSTTSGNCTFKIHELTAIRSPEMCADIKAELGRRNAYESQSPTHAATSPSRCNHGSHATPAVEAFKPLSQYASIERTVESQDALPYRRVGCLSCAFRKSTSTRELQKTSKQVEDDFLQYLTWHECAEVVSAKTDPDGLLVGHMNELLYALRAHQCLSDFAFWGAPSTHVLKLLPSAKFGHPPLEASRLQCNTSGPQSAIVFLFSPIVIRVHVSWRAVCMTNQLKLEAGQCPAHSSKSPEDDASCGHALDGITGLDGAAAVARLGANLQPWAASLALATELARDRIDAG